MSYTPPLGSALSFVFDGEYVSPDGNAVSFLFGEETPPVTGLGSATVELSADASGSVAHCGDGAAEITLSGDASGFVAVFGSAVATLTLDADGAGEALAYQDVVGDGAGVIGLIGSGEGGIPVSGSADSSIGLTASANGVRGAIGVVAGVIELTANGAGQVLAGTEAKCAALLHYEGTAGVQGPFVDETGKVWTVSGAPVFTANHVVGDTGIQLSVAGPDYLTTPFHQDFNFGANDFAIQTWVRAGSFYSARPVISNTNDDNNALGRWYITIDSTSGFPAKVRAFFCSNDGFTYTLTASAVIGFQQDHFISVQRKGLVLSLEVDGVVKQTKTIANATLTFGASSYPIAIGYAFTLSFHGMLDETRILNGVAPDTTLAEAQAGFTLQSDIPVAAVSGDGVGVIELSGDGAGETTVVVEGIGEGVVGLTGSGAGEANQITAVTGKGEATILFADAVGAVAHFGTGQASIFLEGSGVGVIPSISQGSGVIQLTALGSGSAGCGGSAYGDIELSGDGLGVFIERVFGTASGELALSADGFGFSPVPVDDFDALFVRTAQNRIEAYVC